MAEDTVWELEPHTKAKHELLRRYLGAWFPILTSSGVNKRVLFMDGFAGPGIYSNGEHGSPLIALATLVDHSHFDRLTMTEFVFVFVEADRDRFQSLTREIEHFWASRSGGKPANVTVHLRCDEFKDVATELVGLAEEQKKQLAPTLAFIDPFGWSGVPMQTIRDLLSFDRCEVLFNFMFDSVNRFVGDEREGIAPHFAALFGTESDEHRHAVSLSGNERRYFLRDLYLRQLRDVAGFKFVRSFELQDLGRGRTAYFLMFGTRHHKGLATMKEAMWALDPISGSHFTGFAGDRLMLFDDEPDFRPLRTALLARFGGSEVTTDAIKRFVIEETDYKTSHYKKQVLRPLEEEEILVCTSPRKRRFTYPDGVSMRFEALPE